MSLSEQITSIYPELTSADFDTGGSIALQNDSDGAGDYIKAWTYSKPIPSAMKLGK